MTTETVTVAQARNDFSNLLAQVELLHRRFIIARRGRPKAVLISVEDWNRLQDAAQIAQGKAIDERIGEEREASQRLFWPVDLPEGLLRGYDFSPELLHETRRIMWPEPTDGPT